MSQNAIPVGLCQCGCGTQTAPYTETRRDRGQVKGKPRRFVHGHQRRKSPHEYLVDDKGCWIWQRAVGSAGYGMVRGVGTAHRLFYERFKGEIPAGLVIDHLCRVPLCVNPDHLEAVSNAENVRRGRRARLTATQVGEIKRSPLGCRRLARLYDVSRETVLGIRAGRRWKEIT